MKFIPTQPSGQKEIGIPFTANCGEVTVEKAQPLKITSCAPESSTVVNEGASGTDVKWIVNFTGGDESKDYNVNLSSSHGTKVNLISLLPKPDQDYDITLHYDESETGDLPQVEVTNGTSYDGWYQCQPLTIETADTTTPPPADPIGKTPPAFTSKSLNISCTADTDNAPIDTDVNWTATTEDLSSTPGTMKFNWNGTALDNINVQRTILSKTGVYSNKFTKSFASAQSDLQMTVTADLYDNFETLIKSGTTTCIPNVTIYEPPPPPPDPAPPTSNPPADLTLSCNPTSLATGESFNARVQSGEDNTNWSFNWKQNGQIFMATASNATMTAQAGENTVSVDISGPNNIWTANKTCTVTGLRTAANTAYLSNPSISVSPWDPTNETATFSVTLKNADPTNKLSAYVTDGSDLHKTWLLTNAPNGINKFTWDGTSGSSKIKTGTYMFEVVGRSGNATMEKVSLKFKVESVDAETSVGNTGGGSSDGETTIVEVYDRCAGFTDVTKSDPDCDAFTYAKSLGALTGNANGTLRPGDYLQRDQIAKIITESLYTFSDAKDYAAGQYTFPDVTKKDWAYQYVSFAKLNNIVTGYKSGTYAGLYRPAQNVTRAEFLTMLLRAVEDLNKDTMPSIVTNAYADTSSNTWYSPYVKYSKENNLFSGTYLYPTNSVSRREVAQVLYKLHNQKTI